MADVLNRTTLEHRRSVNTPDFGDPPWIKSPDMSGVDGVLHQYWKLSGDAPVEMDQTEKDAVDAAALVAERNALAIGADGRELAAAILRLVVKEINALRSNAGLSVRSKAQVIAALKAEINGGW